MKTALLIVDIQNDYFPGGKMALEHTIEASDNAAALLSAFRRMHLPVIHIQHVAKHAGATFFVPDTEGVKIHKSVAPLSNETVIQKNYPNSFRQTALLEYLNAHQISKLVIAGMMTHMCIDSTTRAACDLEFTVQLAHDACATKTLSFGAVAIPASHVQNAIIAALDGSFAEVLSTQQIIAGFAPKV
jgi:nicotinamidase-related amidase